MSNVEDDWLRIARERDARLGYVVAAENADRGAAVAVAAVGTDAFAVQKSLHVGQEGHELLVVTFAELTRVAGELVGHLRPDALCAQGDEVLPVALHLDALVARHELHRPQHDLPEALDGRGEVSLADIHVHESLWLVGAMTRIPEFTQRKPSCPYVFSCVLRGKGGSGSLCVLASPDPVEGKLGGESVALARRAC